MSEDDKQNEETLRRIISYTGQSTEPLLKKFTQQFLIAYLDRVKIQSIDKIYQSKDEGFNVLEFSRFFLNVIEHKEVETLYLTMALIDFFREISQVNGFCERIKFTFITNYICSKILQKRNSQNQIETKHISDQKSIDPTYQLKDYLLDPPIVYGSNQETVLKLSANKILIDKNKHESVVTNCSYSPSANRIFSLDALSDAIAIYDTSCILIKKIRPCSSRLKKNIIFLSFAYSQRQERIGAVLKDFSLIFWDSVQNFEFEKIISTASHCNQYQTTIYFLKHFNKWVTTDKNGDVYIWNIEKQEPQRLISCRFKTKINDICQIPCMNLLAIVQENRAQKSDFLKKEQDSENKNCIYLYSFMKGEAITKIDLGSEGRVPHSIQYSQTYQVLITAGYEKKISIYEVHPKYMDTNIKGQLLGHQSLVTCFAILQSTPMIVSADDKGKVKVWDIRNYKCLQTLDFRDKSIISRLLSLVEVGKIAVLGSRINLVEFDEKKQLKKRNAKKEKAHPIAIGCDYKNMELIVLTKKDIRVIDLQKGLVKHIFCEFYSSEEEITCFKYIQILKKFIVGNERGQLKIYCMKTGNLQRKLISHSSSITFIDYDQNNKLFVTASADSSIHIQKEKQDSGLMREIKNNFYQKDISVMALTAYHGLIAIGSSDNLVYVWDYEHAKLMTEIRLGPNTQPTVLTFLNFYSILLIGSSDGTMHFLRLSRKEETVVPHCLWEYKVQNAIPTYFLPDIVMKGVGKKPQLTEALLYIGLNNGKVIILDIYSLLCEFKPEPSVSCRQSYNPERQLKQNFVSQIQKKKYTTFQVILDCQSYEEEYLNKVKVEEIQAHASSLTGIQILEMDRRYLLTISLDQRVKLWNGVSLLCDLNINLPLPYLWNLSVVGQKKIKDKIMISLKVIQNIFKKFGSDISIGESKLLKVQKLFEEISDNDITHLTEPPAADFSQKQSITLFQQQFTLQDLHYDLVKKYNFRKIAGPTLREIEVKKNIELMHKEWQNNKLLQQTQKQKLLSSIQYRAHKFQEKDQIMNFLKEKPIRPSQDFNPKKQQPHSMVYDLNENLSILLEHEMKMPFSRSMAKKHDRTVIFMSNLLQRKAFCPKPKKKQVIRTFENYYQEKQPHFCSTFVSGQNSPKKKTHNTTLSCSKSSANFPTFRGILHDMENRVKISRQTKVRTGAQRAGSVPIMTPNDQDKKPKTASNFYSTSTTGITRRRKFCNDFN